MFSNINIQTHGRHNCLCPLPPDTVVTTKYNPIISQGVIKAILYLCTFSSVVQVATLDFSALHLAIHSCSSASASIRRPSYLSFLATSALATSLINLSHTIEVVAQLRGHGFLSNHLKNLQA